MSNPAGLLLSPRAETGVEPFQTRFVTPSDLRAISEFKDSLKDKSISTMVMDPLANFLVRFVPSTVAPNLLTLSSLLCAFHSFYYTQMYRHDWPRTTTTLSVVMFVIYHICDIVDGKHAQRIRNESPLGYLFNHSCDSIAVTFIVLTVAMHLGIDDSHMQWNLVQTGALIHLWAHLSAFMKGYMSYGIFSGPGEALFCVNVVLVVRAVFGLNWVIALFSSRTEFTNVGELLLSGAYYGLLTTVVVKCLTLPPEHHSTRNTLLFCLALRALPGIMLRVGFMQSLSTETVICDGLFMGILATDLVVARMAGRELHDWVAVMALFSMIDKVAILVCVCFYFFTLIFDVATYMNLPLLTVVKNVYIDGVFDLCHLGHKNHIMRALNYGNRLLVGVMSDEDVRKYKRDPIMRTDERVREVEALRCVYKVIPNAPCFGMTEDFIQTHNIHVVLCSPEYDKKEDKYYKVPRELGIVKVMPRTEGVSTSDIIKRIKTRLEAGDI